MINFLDVRIKYLTEYSKQSNFVIWLYNYLLTHISCFMVAIGLKFDDNFGNLINCLRSI